MKTQHDEIMEDPEMRKLLSMEALVAEAAELVAKAMSEQDVSKADLARRLKKSRAWVTQLLNGTANMTVRTLAEAAYALDCEVKLQAQPLRSGAGVRPSGCGWQSVTYKMDGAVAEPSTSHEPIYQLASETITSVDEELVDVTVAERKIRPEYAA